MDDHSVMLEHTLALAGEVVDSGMVWQGWPCTKQFSLESHRRSVRTHLDDLADKRMAKREQSKRDEEMTAAALCWPCTSCCQSETDNRQYDRISLLEEATNSTSHASSSDNNFELGIPNGSNRNLQHLKERSNSFLVQIESELTSLTKDKITGKTENSKNMVIAGDLVKMQAVSLQPLGTKTPLLSVKKGYKEKKEGYGSNL